MPAVLAVPAVAVPVKRAALLGAKYKAPAPAGALVFCNVIHQDG